MKRAEICALRDNTFFATMILEWNGVESEIDARPSDCIALAVQQKSPIYVASKVFNAVEDMTEVLKRMNQEGSEDTNPSEDSSE